MVGFNKYVLLFLVTGFFNTASAQFNSDSASMVGFACFYEGKPSKTVEKFTKKLNIKKYTWISKKLKSNNNAEKYLAVIALEKLKSISAYNLNHEEQKIILDIKKSKDLVEVCSGCSYFQKIELRNMFTPEMTMMSKNWLTKNINQKIIKGSK